MTPRPGDLCLRHLGDRSPSRLGSLRSTRAREGRVIERDGLSILGFGTAAVLELPGGLARPRPGSGRGHELRSPPRPYRHHRRGRPGAAGTTLAGPVGLRCASLRPPGRRRAGRPRADRGRERREQAAVAVVVGARRCASRQISDQPAAAPWTARASSGRSRRQIEFRLASARPHQDFLNRVSAALAEIASGRLDKVVLAREVTVHANRPFRQADLLGRLRALHPSCTAFAIDGFIGATPELLIRRNGLRDRLAAPRGNGGAERGP